MRVFIYIKTHRFWRQLYVSLINTLGFSLFHSVSNVQAFHTQGTSFSSYCRTKSFLYFLTVWRLCFGHDFMQISILIYFLTLKIIHTSK